MTLLHNGLLNVYYTLKLLFQTVLYTLRELGWDKNFSMWWLYSGFKECSCTWKIFLDIALYRERERERLGELNYCHDYCNDKFPRWSLYLYISQILKIPNLFSFFSLTLVVVELSASFWFFTKLKLQNIAVIHGATWQQKMAADYANLICLDWSSAQSFS